MKKYLICYHRVDFDGVLSCCIVEDAIKKHQISIKEEYNIDKFGWTYGDDPVDVNSWLENYDWIFMADIALDAESMEKLYRSEIKFVWIDHHQTAIDTSIERGYDTCPGLRRIGVGACELCWEFMHTDEEVPMLIQYMSAYDVFDKNRFDWEGIVQPVQYAMFTEYGVSEKEVGKHFKELISLDVSSLISEGKIVEKYLKKIWKGWVKNYAFPITVAGRYKGLCMLSTVFNSGQFSSVMDQYEIFVVMNRKNDNQFNLSMYRNPEVCPEFHNGRYLASLFPGAGGHASAAGAQISYEQFEHILKSKEI